MTWFEFIASYAFGATLFYFMFYCFGTEDEGRVDLDENMLLGTLRCIWEDFFRIHCPWSKARSIRCRIQHLWKFVGEYGREHDKISLLTRAELINKHRHAEIAEVCFISRTRFWLKAAFDWLTSPIRMALYMLFMLFVVVPVALYCDIRALIKRS